MKKEYLLKSSVSLLFLFSSTLLATGCNKGDKHNYKEEWDVSPTEHWQACLDEGCKEKKIGPPIHLFGQSKPNQVSTLIK